MIMTKAPKQKEAGRMVQDMRQLNIQLLDMQYASKHKNTTYPSPKSIYRSSTVMSSVDRNITREWVSHQAEEKLGTSPASSQISPSQTQTSLQEELHWLCSEHIITCVVEHWMDQFHSYSNKGKWQPEAVFGPAGWNTSETGNPNKSGNPFITPRSAAFGSSGG